MALEGLKPEEIEAAFWRQLVARGTACLWIVDDVPSGVAASDLQRYWFARGANASTLITTRSREYGALGERLDLGVLSPHEAVELLTRAPRAQKVRKKLPYRRLPSVLGYHPLAVEVAGSYLAKGIQTFQEFLDELSLPNRDAIEYGALLMESLPTGHDRSISRTLFKSISLLGKEGLDFLCLASVLAVEPIHAELVQEVFESAGYGAASRERVQDALDQVDSLSLCESTGENARRVHTLISRAVRFRFRQGNWMKRLWSLISQVVVVQSRRDERIRLLRKAVVRVLTRRLSVVDDRSGAHQNCQRGRSRPAS